MAYRDSQPARMGAVFSASLKSALFGAAITAAFIALAFGLPEASTSQDLFGVFGIALFSFFAGLVVGTIAIAFCLTIFGLPIAYLLRDTLGTATGSMVAVVSAVAVSTLVAVLVGSGPAILAILPFSIPAAIYFRRDILLERELP